MENKVKTCQVWRNRDNKYSIDEVIEEDMGSYSCWATELNDDTESVLISIRTYDSDWVQIKDSHKFNI